MSLAFFPAKGTVVNSSKLWMEKIKTVPLSEMFDRIANVEQLVGEWNDIPPKLYIKKVIYICN